MGALGLPSLRPSRAARGDRDGVRRGTPAPTARRRTPLRVAGVGFVYLWIGFNALIFLWVILSSLKDDSEIFDSPWGLPSSLQFDNYTRAWNDSGLGTAMVNSVMLVGAAAITTIVLAAPAAYALSRFRSRSSGLTLLYFVLGMGVPLQTILIPSYIALAEVNLVDTLGGLYLLYVGFSLPFTVFLLTGFFRTLPGRLEEAAALDGCSGFQTFFHIMLPLARPGLMTALMLNVIGLWNETLLALVFIVDDSRQTLALAMLNFYGTMLYNSAWGALFAGICIVVLPMLALYLWLARHVIEGMTLGATK
jgi:ABC-type glycerol-3-phosphate transport system permease component